MLKTVLALIAGLALLLGGYFLLQPQPIVPIKTKELAQISPSAGSTVSSWKKYTNVTLNYSINYPSDWVVRAFSEPSTGATFRPASKPNDYQYEYISIDKNNRVMLDNLPNPTFEEYVKRAGAEIQNYGNIVTIKKITTNSGITGYTATYTVAPLGSGKAGVSSPRTYFEIPGNNTATIQVQISDENYINIYNQMLASFTFIKKETLTTDPNLKIYNSSKLGISFSFLEKQGSQEMTVKENGNKICVTYDVNDNDCSKGQSVEIFQKEASETLKDAISRLFLVGKDPVRCLVTVSDPKNYPPTFAQGEITFPDSGNIDLEKMSADTEYCSPNYAQTNGIRYFLEDKLHPTKLLFVSIGQYGISSDGNKMWQETINFE